MTKTAPPPLIDIGANLGHESFHDDLPRVLEQARAAGIESIVVTGTSIEASEKALSLAQAHPGYLYSTAGIHPHEASGYDTASGTRLRTLAGNPQVKALGETGLDFNRNYSPRDAQLYAFEAQLELAVELELPVFLHQRDAHPEFLALLKKYRPRLRQAVVHCFTGTRAELDDYLELDVYIGLTGWICDERRGSHLLEITPLIPQERLLLETDAPYLLPRTIRPKPSSRRNEPCYLEYVAATVAASLGIAVSELARFTTKNAKTFFNL